MDGGHSFHRDPSCGVFPSLKLLDFFFMAIGAGLRRGNLDFCDVLCCFMFFAVADGTGDVILAVFAQLPVRNDIGGNLLVALNTFLSQKRRSEKRGYQKDEQGPASHLSPPASFIDFSNSIPFREVKVKAKKFYEKQRKNLDILIIYI
jgi:hypothetical protein